MYYRYNNDVEAFVERLKGTVRFDKDSKSLVNDEQNCDKHLGNEQMMNLLCRITDSIGDTIKWEADYAEKYNDKCIPILDMKVMMDREDNKEAGKFHFYQKHMAHKNVVSAYNAIPSRMALNTLIKEGMMRMRNTSPSLLPDENRELLKTFSLWMAKSYHN